MMFEGVEPRPFLLLVPYSEKNMATSTINREEVRHLVDILPNEDLPTAARVLKAILATSIVSEIPLTPELAEEFAF